MLKLFKIIYKKIWCIKIENFGSKISLKVDMSIKNKSFFMSLTWSADIFFISTNIEKYFVTIRKSENSAFQIISGLKVF